jgi:predicted MFS family arabinose efflux permease
VVAVTGPQAWPYRYRVLALCTGAFLTTMVARVVISPVVPDLTAAFDTSTGAIGLALTGMWAAYAVTQFPSGVLADRHGERIVILGALAATGTASLLLAFSPSYVVFLALAVGLGGAAGLVYSAAVSLLTRESEETGRAIGFYIMGGPIAGLLAPPLAAEVGTSFGWRPAIALGAVLALPVALLFARGIRREDPVRPDESLREHLDVGELAELLSRPPIVHAAALAFLGAFTWQATASFLPAFLETYHGFSRTEASWLFSGYFVVHGIAQPLTGVLSDRVSRNAAALATMGSGVVGYSLFLVGSTLATIVPAIVVTGLAMSWGAPLQSKFMDNLSAVEQGTGFGLVRTVYMSLGSLGSVVTGTVVDLAGWAPAIGVLVGMMALASLLLIVGLAVEGL